LDLFATVAELIGAIGVYPQGARPHNVLTLAALEVRLIDRDEYADTPGRCIKRLNPLPRLDQRAMEQLSVVTITIADEQKSEFLRHRIQNY
jgi:hypothetical protein